MKTRARMKQAGMVLLMALAAGTAVAQEQSVAPGINQRFLDRPFEAWADSFHKEGREVFDKRSEIIAFSQVGAGMTVADVGAGTGLFSRLFSNAVGAGGKVYAVDVGEGQLHPRLAADPRVIRLEGVNARALDHGQVPEPIGAIVADISFISLRLGLPPRPAVRTFSILSTTSWPCTTLPNTA